MNRIIQLGEEKVSRNIRTIFQHESSKDLWEFFSFYDRVVEQQRVIQKKVFIRDQVEVATKIIGEMIGENLENYEKGLRMIESLAGGSSRVKFTPLAREETPRFRNQDEGDETLTERQKEKGNEYSYVSKEKQRKIILNNLKASHRSDIKPEQIGVAILFSQLEKLFPVKNYKILLSGEKLEIILRNLRLLDKLVRNNMTGDLDKMRLADSKRENKIYYDQDEDSDDEMSNFRMFSYSRKKKRTKNTILETLKQRKYSSLIDDKQIANLLEKLSSLGYERLEFFRVIFSFNGLVRHSKSMETLMNNMASYLRSKNFKFNEIRYIFQIFENKLENIRLQTTMLKSKFEYIRDKMATYKNPVNKKRALTLLVKLKARYSSKKRLLAIVEKKKQDLFTKVFSALYKKKFPEEGERVNHNVKSCIKDTDKISKLIPNSKITSSICWSF